MTEKAMTVSTNFPVINHGELVANILLDMTIARKGDSVCAEGAFFKADTPALLVVNTPLSDEDKERGGIYINLQDKDGVAAYSIQCAEGISIIPLEPFREKCSVGKSGDLCFCVDDEMTGFIVFCVFALDHEGVI